MGYLPGSGSKSSISFNFLHRLLNSFSNNYNVYSTALWSKNLNDSDLTQLASSPVANRILNTPIEDMLGNIRSLGDISNYTNEEFTITQASYFLSLLKQSLRVLKTYGIVYFFEEKSELKVSHKSSGKDVLFSLEGEKSVNNIGQLLCIMTYDCMINSLLSQGDKYLNPIFKMESLHTVSNKKEMEEFESKITEVFKSFNVNAPIIMGKDDEYGYITPDYTGLEKLQEILMKNISLASSIPITKLFGDSASGMNATGEGDRKNYSQKLRNIYNMEFLPLISFFKDYFKGLSSVEFSYFDADEDIVKYESILKKINALEIAVQNGFLEGEEAKIISNKINW